MARRLQHMLLCSLDPQSLSGQQAPPEPCCYFRTDAALPTPTYGSQFFFDWNKALPSTVKEEPPEGTLAGNGWMAGPNPSGMEVDGGTWVLQVKPRSAGILSRCSPRSCAQPLGMGFAAERRKGSQGQHAFETGKAGCGAGSVDKRGSSKQSSGCRSWTAGL